MKLKRIIAALASVVILCGMTGCGSSGTTTDTSTRTKVSQTQNGQPISPGVLRGSGKLN